MYAKNNFTKHYKYVNMNSFTASPSVSDSINNSNFITSFSGNGNSTYYNNGPTGNDISNNLNLISGFSGYGNSTYYNGGFLGNINYNGTGANFNTLQYNQNKISPNIMSQDISYVITFGNNGTNYISKKNYNKIKRNIKLPKKILDYLEISKSECSTNELKSALVEKSDKNKKLWTLKNPTKNHYQQNTIFLDKKGKDLFDIKGNFVTVDCLIDILFNEYVPDVPDYDFLEVNQQPIEVKNLNFNFLFL